MDALVNCKACFGEIDPRANYCKFCKRPQTKSAKYKRFIPTLIGLVLLVTWFVIASNELRGNKFTKNPRPVFAENKNNLVVTSSEVSFKTCGECKADTSVVVIGFVENKTDVVWDTLKFEVRFYNEADELIDTVSKTAYGLAVPALSEVSFRVMDVAGKEQEAYVSHKVFINDADPEFRF